MLEKRKRYIQPSSRRRLAGSCSEPGRRFPSTARGSAGSPPASPCARRTPARPCGAPACGSSGCSRAAATTHRPGRPCGSTWQRWPAGGTGRPAGQVENVHEACRPWSVVGSSSSLMSSPCSTVDGFISGPALPGPRSQRLLPAQLRSVVEQRVAVDFRFVAAVGDHHRNPRQETAPATATSLNQPSTTKIRIRQTMRIPMASGVLDHALAHVFGMRCRGVRDAVDLRIAGEPRHASPGTAVRVGFRVSRLFDHAPKAYLQFSHHRQEAPKRALRSEAVKIQPPPRSHAAAEFRSTHV